MAKVGQHTVPPGLQARVGLDKGAQWWWSNLLSVIDWCLMLDGGNWPNRHHFQGVNVSIMPDGPTGGSLGNSVPYFRILGEEAQFKAPLWSELPWDWHVSIQGMQLEGVRVEVQESVPPNAPVLWGKEVDIQLYVNSDHAGNRVTRRSRTGFLVYVNSALRVWNWKEQNCRIVSVWCWVCSIEECHGGSPRSSV